MLEDIFADRLRIVRKKRKLTQAELAKLMDTTQNNISCWEASRQTPAYEKIIKLAKLLNVSIYYLFGQDKKTQELFNELKPRIIIDIQENGSDYTKYTYSKSIEKINELTTQYDSTKDKKLLYDIEMHNFELNQLLFNCAYDELVNIDPDNE